MIRGRPTVILLSLLGALVLHSQVGATTEPTIAVTPPIGTCAEDVTILGSGFVPESDVTITGIFDLIETTVLGSATAGHDGEFVFGIPEDLMPVDCWQGRKLLLAVEVVGDSSEASRATTFFLVDGPWRVELDPAVTDCKDPVSVRGTGFDAEQQIFLAWGEVDLFVEANFFEIGSAETDVSGKFETSIDVTRRCNQDGAWGIYALVQGEHGQPVRDGWAEAVLHVKGPSVPEPAARTSETPEASSSAGPVSTRTVAAPADSGGKQAETDSGGGRSGMAILAVSTLVLAMLAGVALAVRKRAPGR